MIVPRSAISWLHFWLALDWERSPPRFFYFAWFSRIEWWFVFVGAPEEIINKEKWGYTMIFCAAPKLIPPGPGGLWTLKKNFWWNNSFSGSIDQHTIFWWKYLDFYMKWAFLSKLCLIVFLNYMYKWTYVFKCSSHCTDHNQ